MGLCCYFMSWASAVALGVVVAPMILLILASHVPRCWHPGPYPPLAPPNPGSCWLVRPPGVPFGYVFVLALCALYYVGLGVIVWARDLGLEWGLGGLIAMAVLDLGVAIALGRALRTRPELEVDEARRELRWRPHAIWARPVTLPFDAVVGVRVVTGRYVRYDPPEEFYQPEISWRLDTGRVRMTRLPISADRQRVEEVAARLRAAVFSTLAEPVAAPDPAA
jgi:hypothetical protein